MNLVLFFRPNTDDQISSLQKYNILFHNLIHNIDMIRFINSNTRSPSWIRSMNYQISNTTLTATTKTLNSLIHLSRKNDIGFSILNF